MRRILFACFCLLLNGALSAQVMSRLGRFSVDYDQGCAPFTVTILDAGLSPSGADCNGATPCIMTYTGTAPSACPPAGNAECGTNKFSATYTVPGTYKLRVLYQSIGEDDITITVNEPIVPDIEIYRCSGNGVRINATDNTYQQYVIAFGDATPNVTIPSQTTSQPHTYPAAGNYLVAVHGRPVNPNAFDNCPATSQAIGALTSLPMPTINSVTATSPNSVQLQMTNQQFILYHLEILVPGQTNFQVHSNVYNVTSVDVSNLLLDNNFYCFRLSAFDPCTGGNTYSNTICTQDFDVAFNNGVNKLTWRTITAGVSSVSILRKDITNTTSQTTGIPGAPLAFNDTDYDCNVQYCYTLTVNYGSATSTSLEKCGTGILTTTHPAIDDLHATVANGADLVWQLPVPAAPNPPINLKTFQILRSTGNSPLALFTTTTDETLTDATYTTEGAHCYQVNYLDQCDNSSAPGVIACPVQLSATMDASNVATLNWTAYSGWLGGIQTYAIEKLNSAGTVVQPTVVVNPPETTFVDDRPDPANQIVSYRVRVVPNVGTNYSYSNVVTFTKDINLTFPTAFTPNGDKLNDVFTISGNYVTKMNIRVFDRWGALVFGSEGNDAWNGTREGTAMPESSYVWKAEITDFAGRSFSREGTVVLLRK